MKNLENVVIFSTKASLYFAELIAMRLGLEVGSIEHKDFGGVEQYYRIGMANRDDLIGKTAIFVGSTHTDDQVNELYRVGSALAGYGTVRRIFVIPFLGYSTMERAKYPGEVVMAKVIARQLSNIPNSGMGNVFLMMDLHVSGLVHYFEGDCQRYELYAEKQLTIAMSELKLDNFMFASADLGRPAWVATFAKLFQTSFALIDKGREFDETEVLAVIGDVRGKNVIIYDDMTRSATTIINAANAYIEHGATGVYAVLSHCALNHPNIIGHLINSPIKKVITTNTHPISQEVAHISKLQSPLAGRFQVCDVSGEFVRTIQKVLNNN
ncbi:ribose-phosphate pyrophosphokinase [Candidatus Falkowbacteria bacterium]|nr:ribose-phosphate pyrophosphokinase [Candidatus Falkowbacteria bacterium]